MRHMIKAGHLGGNIYGGDPYTYEPRLWRYLIDKFRIRSVLDVGCGQGHSLAEFSRLGCWAVGLDGLAENANYLAVPVIQHDLTSGPFYISNIDLVWSCEVAEHIIESCVDNFVSTLCCGKTIAMTFAPTGALGYHHKNLQSQEYWIQKIEERGYHYSLEDTLEAMDVAEHQFFRENGLVFHRSC